MDDKTLQALTDLASKLGTTAEYLWGVLIKQAPIAGFTGLTVIAAWVVAVVAWVMFVKRKTTAPIKTEANQYPRAEWNDEAGVSLAWASVFLAGLIAAIVVAEIMPTVIAAIFNPEYWALKQILK